MVDGNRCEVCREIVPEEKACHKQTKYCDGCARSKKLAGTQSSWSRDEKAAYMRGYMRGYRKRHQRLSTPYVRKHREKLREGSRTAPYRSVAIPVLLLSLLFMQSGNLSPHSDTLPVLISHVELIVIKVTGLIVVVIICWEHLKRFWKDR